jgi:CxxC motif-containing protein
MSARTERSLVCIACPIGCRLTVLLEDTGAITVTGNQCAKGETYGQEEVLAPRRVVTATVHLADSILRRLPVKTSRALPREHINALLAAVYRLRVAPPVRLGQVLLADFLGTGVDVVATRSVGAERN